MPCFAASVTFIRALATYPECSCSSIDRITATRPHFTGFEASSLGRQYNIESSTGWSSWYSSRCEAKPRRTWRRNASSSPTTVGDVIFILPTLSSAPSRGPVLGWATDVSLSLDHQSGRVYPAACDILTWTCTVQTTTEDIFVCLRPRRSCDSVVFGVSCINSFTYLLTDRHMHAMA